mmetsp:Transcript_70735/g.188653  ORF Transcript_70735/g.188653 Transcript_70735/m.188653 type:complete len:334 (+) Transcript_70735:98-1099(+)
MAMAEGRRIVVTGAAGFIGGHVAERLVVRGDHVVIVDCHNDYYDSAVKNANVEAVKEAAQKAGAGSVQAHKVDILDKPALTALFEEVKPDIIVHLAAQAGVRHSINNLHEAISINLVGTVNLLELAHAFKVSHVVCASSSSVYGQSSVAPFSEDQMCDKPISPYAASKRSAELFAHTLHHLYGIKITLLRFFTVYGPRGRPDMAVYKFIDKIFRGEPIDRFGDGSAVREFTYVDDIVDGVLAAVDRPQDFAIVNLGGGATHTLAELISTVEKHCGRPAVINQMPQQAGDVDITSADQKEAQRILDFHPRISLDEGIRRTVEWYRQYKGIPAPT